MLIYLWICAIVRVTNTNYTKNTKGGQNDRGSFGEIRQDRG